MRCSKTDTSYSVAIAIDHSTEMNFNRPSVFNHEIELTFSTNPLFSSL